MHLLLLILGTDGRTSLKLMSRLPGFYRPCSNMPSRSVWINPDSYPEGENQYVKELSHNAREFWTHRVIFSILGNQGSDIFELPGCVLRLAGALLEGPVFFA